MEKLSVSAAEAAKMISTSQQATLEMIRSGEIYAYRQGNRWMVPVRLLETTVIDRAVAETKERRKECQKECK